MIPAPRSFSRLTLFKNYHVYAKIPEGSAVRCSVLKELSSKEYPDKENRRWFSDDYFDLIIWMKDTTTIRVVQLCYDKRGLERAITWRKDGGFIHERVDDGEANPEKNRSPILIPDGACPIKELIERYAAASVQIDPFIADFVMSKLREYTAVLKA